MHTVSYTGGFLYHPPSGKILLHQSRENKDTDTWSLFSDILAHKDGSISFQSIISKTLHVNLAADAIFPVYDYDRPEAGEVHLIYYAIVENQNIPIQTKGGHKAAWFTPKQITKLQLLPQDMHDIIIAARVIQADARDKENNTTQ
ncbi:hypothetical protein A2154_04070 [Candidatus Gottesmanbacteria bacterium RBG_16_43_7]|uniref:Nudix hydrolase domain-containing protein n=1 Tax=Candidatus Gottesmanbacteria bacterium RBG_16_43_7 TaxID=1798373 RepID=A0A1F5Z969_9BACT|nr:MAG: hypothetical protein A2154_04070 [Candidatus Gottesmanbacteria bacterium RBG_16_43_7]